MSSGLSTFPLVFIAGGGNTVPKYRVVDGYFNQLDAASFVLTSVMFNTMVHLLLVFD